MGYSTTFSGAFTLTPCPKTETIILLRSLEGVSNRDDLEECLNVPEAGAIITTLGPMPDSYNQWELTKDCQHLEWDGGEKFYHYDAWLQWLIDYVLTPQGITIAGTVEYAGEEISDRGILTIEAGQVVKQQVDLLGTDVTELRAFKQFVLESRWGETLLAQWERKRHAD